MGKKVCLSLTTQIATITGSMVSILHCIQKMSNYYSLQQKSSVHMLCKSLLKKNVLHIKSNFHWLIGKNPQGDFCINPETPPIWISSAFIWHLDHWLDAEHTFITHTTKLNQGGIHTLYEYKNSAADWLLQYDALGSLQHRLFASSPPFAGL